MSKRYHMENLGLNALVGRKIISAMTNADKDLVVLETDKGPLYLTWVGDCCSKCYVAHASGIDALIGGTVSEAYHAEWKDLQRNDDDYEVVESMGTNIKTDKGYITLEARLVHNGFYSGWVEISDDEPIDQYSSPRQKWQDIHLEALEDF